MRGLDRVTISLDSLDTANFADITGVDALGKVIDAIDTPSDSDRTRKITP